MVLTTSQLRVEWSPACTSSLFHTIHPNASEGKANLTIRGLTEDAWWALDQVMLYHHYFVRAADTGSYSCRAITGGLGYSLHSYGIATDYNWQTNPYGPTLKTDMPSAMVNDILAIRTNSGAQVFRWGGNYSGNKDAMHYEVVCTQEEMQSGINWNTVKGHIVVPPPLPVPEPPEDFMATMSEATKFEIQLGEATTIVLSWYGLFDGRNPLIHSDWTNHQGVVQDGYDPGGVLWWRNRVLGVLEDATSSRLKALESEFASLVANAAGLSPAVAPGKP